MEQRLQFESKFLIGIDRIDQEHRQLFEIAGKVYDALGADRAAAIDTTCAAVAELRDFMATHFASEEALMQAADYPGLAGHRAVHEQLLLRGRDIEIQAAIGERYSPAELGHFLYTCLADHLHDDDRKFGEFMAAHSSAATTGSPRV